MLASFTAGLLSVVPVLEQPDYMTLLSARQSEVVSGALFQTLMVPAYAGFALVLYPVLRRADATLSLGFVGFRLVACGFHLLAVVMLPLLLHLADGYDATAASSGDASIAEVLRLARDLVNHVVVIVTLCLGDLMLFTLLFRRRLVPAWLSVWGIVGAALAILGSLLFLARAVDVVSGPYLLLNAPLALHGLVLAGWLIARGLNTRFLTEAADLSSASVAVPKAS